MIPPPQEQGVAGSHSVSKLLSSVEFPIEEPSVSTLAEPIPLAQTALTSVTSSITDTQDAIRSTSHSHSPTRLPSASEMEKTDAKLEVDAPDTPAALEEQVSIIETVNGAQMATPGDEESTPTATPTAAVPVEDSAQPTGAPLMASALPKARLPHDKIGILEDRIKEDERGDIEAWLTLISEHRKRGKLDDARRTFARFLQVFPQCVSCLEESLARVCH